MNFLIGIFNRINKYIMNIKIGGSMSSAVFYSFMHTMSVIIENLSFYLFCSLVALFIIPQSLYNLFYFLPNMIRFALKKQIVWGGMWHVLKEVVAWTIFLSAFYFLFVFISPDITYDLYFGFGSIISWITGIIVLLYNIFFKPQFIIDEYYENLFIRYATTATLSVYEEFVANLDVLNYEAIISMNKKQLNYLEKKSLNKRIKQIETENFVKKQKRNMQN